MRSIATLTAATVCVLTTPAATQARQPSGKLLPSEVLKRQLDEVDRDAERDARGFRHSEVSGAQVAENVARLTSRLRWHDDLGAALRAGRQQDKPVVWVHALGDLTGFL